MMLGLSLSAFTALHAVISLVGIVAGVVVLFGMIGDKRLTGWTALFLATTVATSVTGFMFPSAGVDPAQVVGGISLLVLAIALIALYGRHLVGFWRPTYIVCAVLALYLNAFVGVVQAFQKVSFLQPLAPTQSEPPFKAAQLVVLLIFVAAGFLAVRRFHRLPHTVG
jgi:hypothetical protein